MQVASIKNEYGTRARNAKQKSDLIAAYLEDTFQSLPRETAQENIYPINERGYIEVTSVTLQELKN